MSPSSSFYLGRLYDPAKKTALSDNFTYSPDNLTTHAFVTGMTGSGKTGLCVGLLEEAALAGIPAIIIDPKGDLTNLALHFPELAPADFEPWMDPEVAKRSGKTVQQMAAETAEKWKNGLASSGLGRDQLLALQNSVDFCVYTPGSSAGVSVNILSSFAAPTAAWEENREVLRETISSSVTALLGLVGINDIDPLRSREHILLSNLVETAWSQGKSLELTDLILQVQNPPFERLGAFPLENFFPEKDRFELAMLLNNFLASPSFQTWVEGENLNIEAMLYTPEGKPRHSIFYLSHLSDGEKMFFVTLLLSAVDTWMRTQSGTSALRALVYFDEIYGYLPPVERPPSHGVLLRMLKQARAFGVGMLLATQNPVDVDYKALSNMGTWMIGRLQTERDVNRLLDGLQATGANLDRDEYGRLIAGLDKRVFLLHSIHSGQKLFTTRWCLNYLAGPLTRTQIPAVNRLLDKSAPAAAQPRSASPAAGQVAAQSVAASASAPTPTRPRASISASGTKPAGAGGYSATRQSPPMEIQEYFLPVRLGTSEAAAALNLPPSVNIQPEGIVYHPVLLAQAQVSIYNARYNLQHTRPLAALVPELSAARVAWDSQAATPVEAAGLHAQPMPNTTFAPLPGWLSDPKRIKSLQTDFVEWAYRNGGIRLRANEALKVYAGPEVTTADFREQCSQAARAGLEAELAKIETAYERKVSTLEAKVSKQKLEVEEQQDELEGRRLEELGTHGELLLSMFNKRKRSLSSSLSKRRQTAQAKADLEQERKDLEAIEKQLAALEAEYQAAVKQAQERWGGLVNNVTEIPVQPLKKDIFVEFFGVAWAPYYLVMVDGQPRETPAY